MITVNASKFEKVVEAARKSASADARWLRAIEKAIEQIESNPYMDYSNGALLVLGNSGQIYTANGACQCKAYEAGTACWHRAAAKLLKNYFATDGLAPARPLNLVHRNGGVYLDGFAI